MKFFCFLFAVVCLLESTMIPACMHVKEGIESISILKEEQSCCSEKKEACESPSDKSVNDCSSACSPFQHCGCCNLNFSGVLTLSFGLPQTFDSVVKVENFVFHTRLPESYLSLNDPPPKFS